MMVNLFDQEMLARQKREAMERQSAQRQLLDSLTRRGETRRGGIGTLVASLRMRLGTTERPAISTRTA